MQKRRAVFHPQACCHAVKNGSNDALCVSCTQRKYMRGSNHNDIFPKCLDGVSKRNSRAQQCFSGH